MPSATSGTRPKGPAVRFLRPARRVRLKQAVAAGLFFRLQADEPVSARLLHEDALDAAGVGARHVVRQPIAAENPLRDFDDDVVGLRAGVVVEA